MPNVRTWLPAALALTTVLVSVEARAQAEAPGCSASGPIPSALPSRLLFGINSGTPDDNYVKSSGAGWDIQWLYLSGPPGNNWYNTWGGGSGDGSFAADMFSTIDGHGVIPGIHLYNIGYGHDMGDAGLLTLVQDVDFATDYFTEFKVMMQRAKTFGKPVIIMIEGDSFGMLEGLTNNNPDTKAAVASTGLPELADLPNTIAGFAMGYLAMRKAVGAYNVVMGIDMPYYAANGDIMNYAPTNTQDLGPHRDHQWAFYGSFVGDNQTGDRFDFMASAPDAADCEYYAAQGDDRCWDPSDSASVNSKSINRYVEWLHLMNEISGTPWLLHQFPFGNSEHLNVPFNGSARSGYGDNRAEYLLQFEDPASEEIRDQHLANFADAGVVVILFGSSDDGVTPQTDLWKDDEPFLATHVAAVNNNGGFPITRRDGDVCTATGSGGTSSGGSGGQAGEGPGTGGTGGSGAASGRGGGGRGGTSSATGGTSSATGGTSSATGGTDAAGGTDATGGTGTAPGGRSSMGTGGRGSSSGGTSNSAGSSSVKSLAIPADEDSGCGCHLVGNTPDKSLRFSAALLALGLLLGRRRASRRRLGSA